MGSIDVLQAMVQDLRAILNPAVTLAVVLSISTSIAVMIYSDHFMDDDSDTQH